MLLWISRRWLFRRLMSKKEGFFPYAFRFLFFYFWSFFNLEHNFLLTIPSRWFVRIQRKTKFCFYVKISSKLHVQQFFLHVWKRSNHCFKVTLNWLDLRKTWVDGKCHDGNSQTFNYYKITNDRKIIKKLHNWQNVNLAERS